MEPEGSTSKTMRLKTPVLFVIWILAFECIVVSAIDSFRDRLPEIAGGASFPICVALILQSGDDLKYSFLGVMVFLMTIFNTLFPENPPQPWLALSSVLVVATMALSYKLA